ncbi:MAG: hypothetical protein ACNYPG_00685 [Candidatus Porifericomitaceae bacterium WSBS_2022_MAG_OTU9]
MSPDNNPKTDSGKAKSICPFCALLCEDVVPASNSALAKMPCITAQAGYYNDFDQALPAMVRGQPCSLEQAYLHAADILKKVKRPLLAGLDTDVAGIRAAVNLARQCDGILDHMHGDAISSYAAIMREARWFGMTLAELRQRADLVLCIGCDFSKTQPLLLHRIMAPGNKKKLLFIASKNIPSVATTANNRPVKADIATSEVPAAIAQISLYLRGLTAQRRSVGGKAVAFWKRYATAMRQANYVGIIFKPSGNTTERLTQIRAIMQLTELLNEHGRAAIYTVIDGAGTTTAMQTSLWLTGFPLRVAFSNGGIEHDPVRFATKQLLRNREVDALLWVASTSGAAVPAAPGLPKIVLSRADRRQKRNADVYIPVATPGIGGAGVLFRGDSVVALPLRPRSGAIKQPEVAQVLTAIGKCLKKS